jgi:mono/diheme cytochrome c family protein
MRNLLIMLALLTAVPASAGSLAQQNYILRCAGCHQVDGSGAPGSGVPNIKGRLGYFARLDSGRAYLVQVPGTANSALDDAQVAELLNWMLNHFSASELPPGFQPYTRAEVTRLRAVRPNNVTAERARLLVLLREQGYPPDHLQ